MKPRFFGTLIVCFLAVLTVGAFSALVIFCFFRWWDTATTVATLFVGFVAADVVYWQGYLIKRQLAFSTYLDLDKEWNSDAMITTRQNAYDPSTNRWDDSRLEGALEFFEKLASLFKVAGDMHFIYDSTLGWYAAHYFLYAREHNLIENLRKDWGYVYGDLQSFYEYYLAHEAGRSKQAQQAWEAERLSKEGRFWEQERKD